MAAASQFKRCGMFWEPIEEMLRHSRIPSASAHSLIQDSRKLREISQSLSEGTHSIDGQVAQIVLLKHVNKAVVMKCSKPVQKSVMNAVEAKVLEVLLAVSRKRR